MNNSGFGVYKAIGDNGFTFSKYTRDTEVWIDFYDIPEVKKNFKHIKPGIYFASSFGKFMSKQVDKTVGKELKTTKGDDGYYRVYISVDGYKKIFIAHRIVFSAFNVCLLKKWNVVDHVNADREDNRFFNLQGSNFVDNTNNKRTKENMSRGEWSLYYADNKRKVRDFVSKTEALDFLGRDDTPGNGEVCCGCFVLLPKGVDISKVDVKTQGIKKYFIINEDRSLIVTGSTVKSPLSAVDRKKVSLLEYNESIYISNKKSKFTIRRLTSVEIWEYVEKYKAYKRLENLKRTSRYKAVLEDMQNNAYSITELEYVDALYHACIEDTEEVEEFLIENMDKYPNLLEDLRTWKENRTNKK